MGKRKKSGQIRAFNTRIPVILLGLVFSLFGILFGREAKELLILSLVILTVSAALLFAEPVLYVFTRDGLISVFLFGYKKCLIWQNVSSIHRHREPIWNLLKNHYTVHYGILFRGRWVQQFTQLPVTHRITEGFKAYSGKGIRDDEMPRSKRKKR